MKKIKTLVAAVAVLALASVAFAADIVRVTGSPGSPVTIVQSGATDSGEVYAAITNGTTLTLTNAVIDCTGGKQVCVQVKAELHDAGATACTFTLQGSGDKVHWTATTPVTTPSIVWTPNGTTAVVTVTNIPVNGIPYLRVRTIVNPAGNTDSYLTNYSVKYFVK